MCHNHRTLMISQIAELSRLLGMMPQDGTIEMHEPMTQNKMALSDWLRDTRGAFLKLSLYISKEMDLPLQ